MMTIANNTIHTINGTHYSASDIFHASGSQTKDRVTYFLKQKHIKEMQRAYEAEAYDVDIPTSKRKAVIIVRGKGKRQGTYLCRELVYAYAMWISPEFALAVIRAFDDMMTRQHSYKHLMQLHREYDYATLEAGKAGYALNYYGKKVKPAIKTEIVKLEAIVQPELPLDHSISMEGV